MTSQEKKEFLSRYLEILAEEKDIRLDMILSAQNPGLNPVVIRDAFCEAYPELTPDFMAVHRREALDINEKPFR